MVERHGRAPVATFHAPVPLTAGSVVTLGEEQAHHARVKRLAAGDVVRLTDGSGTVATGAIAALRKSVCELSIEECHIIPRPVPIHLRVPVGDRDRMLWLAEKAAELGAASWQAVRFARSASVSPRGEGKAFAVKVRARMIAALEQSGGAWLPAVLPDVALAELALATGQHGIMLDAQGTPLLAIAERAEVREPVVLFGPEGGMEPSEHALLQHVGWCSAMLAETTLRFETAGLAALAVLRAVCLLKEKEEKDTQGENAHG